MDKQKDSSTAARPKKSKPSFSFTEDDIDAVLGISKKMSVGSKRKRSETQKEVIKSHKKQKQNPKEGEDKPKETAGEKAARRQEEFLERRKRDRTAGVLPENQPRPRQIVLEAARTNWNNATYVNALHKLSSEKPTEQQIRYLDHASVLGPNYLGRAASLKTGFAFDSSWNSTNGFTSQKLLMPAADTHNDQAMHQDIASMTQGDLVYMLGQHLIWNDIPSDEFLSYSKEPLFLVIHALNRFHQKQGHVTIQFLDRRKATDFEGNPAKFYHALDIYEAFGVPKWNGWRGQTVQKLHPRKFTQEFLSHGTIKVQDDRFQAVTVGQLIKDGLYEIFPEFKVCQNDKRTGLYQGQVACRRIGYPPGDVKVQRDKRIYSYSRCAKIVPFTEELLNKVQSLTRNFMKDSSQEPHLHIFLSFLTFHKRPRRDAAFLDWIKEHYKREDVIDLYDNGRGGVQPGFTHVANNLPGVMQYLDLIRDAQHAFDLPPLARNVLEKENSLTGLAYAEADAKLNRQAATSEPFDPEKHRDGKEKARLLRKQKKEALTAKPGSAAIEASATPVSNEEFDVVGGGEGDKAGGSEEVGNPEEAADDMTSEALQSESSQTEQMVLVDGTQTQSDLENA